MYKDSYSVRSVPELITSSGSALLHFFSDDAYNMSGFNISYAINACPSQYSSINCSGNINNYTITIYNMKNLSILYAQVTAFAIIQYVNVTTDGKAKLAIDRPVQVLY